MVENRRGSGRGLSALLGEAEEGAVRGETRPGGEGAREIPIELIRRNPDQPRRRFDEAELAELEASIRASGVLQPILLRPAKEADGHYEIVAGERRWRAAQRAGMTAMPALVRQIADGQAFEMAIVENVQRADLNAMEEARAYSALMERLQYTQEQAAGAVGKSRSHVANTLRLLQLPAEVQAQVLARGLSVREAEALARPKADAPKKASGPRRPKDADTSALEADLEDVLGMSVDITDKGGAGEVRVRYTTLEQLDEICRRLTRV
jgi:ParB family chromosome partitioning protein